MTKSTHPYKICIVAGEVSGDQLGAGLIAELKKSYPNAEFVGIGGELMREQGCKTWYDISSLSYFGFVDVLKNIFSILKTIKHTKELCKQEKVDIFIGIDNPDFNLRVEHYCKNTLLIPVVHYVSPSVWAWRSGRVETIKRACDHVLCLLPFEPEFYQLRNQPASYVGHRLANQMSPKLSSDIEAFARLDNQIFEKLEHLKQEQERLQINKELQPEVHSEAKVAASVTADSTAADSTTADSTTADSTTADLSTTDSNSAASSTDNQPSSHSDSAYQFHQSELTQLLENPEFSNKLVAEEKLPRFLDFLKSLPSYQHACKHLELDPEVFHLAVLPGSRSKEISYILPDFLKGVKLAIDNKLIPASTQILIPIAKPKLTNSINTICKTFQDQGLTIKTFAKQTHQVLAASLVALVASGTATVDTMLSHVPMVIGYRLSSLNYLIASHLVETECVGLSNIIQGEEVSKELIQSDLTPENIYEELRLLLTPAKFYQTRLKFFQLHRELVKNSDQLAAQVVGEILQKAYGDK